MRVLLLISVAAALFGQTEQNAVPNPSAVIDQAVRAIAKSSLGLARPMPQFRLNQPAAPSDAASTASKAPSKCAVPLLELKVPDGTNFTIKQVKPPQDFADHMAVAHGVPACPNARK